ncbi:MAG: hypothetical protein GX872_03705 [Firmicutes bacterium]|nr:hypothetical protein [Bacillota bacterium]HXL03347.1 hypothetical protein [Bacillota bacterium]
MLNEETLQAVRLISDNLLYPEAVTFVNENDVPEDSQLTGLLEYSRQNDDLMRFIKRQEDRDWTGKKEHYKTFYRSLDSYLNNLRKKCKDEFDLVPADLGRTETKERVNEVSTLLAQEYITHLVAEALLKNAKERRNRKRGERT